jgi:hypothetical protein
MIDFASGIMTRLKISQHAIYPRQAIAFVGPIFVFSKS